MKFRVKVRVKTALFMLLFLLLFIQSVFSGTEITKIFIEAFGADNMYETASVKAVPSIGNEYSFFSPSFWRGSGNAPIHGPCFLGCLHKKGLYKFYRVKHISLSRQPEHFMMQKRITAFTISASAAANIFLKILSWILSRHI